MMFKLYLSCAGLLALCGSAEGAGLFDPFQGTEEATASSLSSGLFISETDSNAPAQGGNVVIGQPVDSSSLLDQGALDSKDPVTGGNVVIGSPPEKLCTAKAKDAVSIDTVTAPCWRVSGAAYSFPSPYRYGVLLPEEDDEQNSIEPVRVNIIKVDGAPADAGQDKPAQGVNVIPAE